MFFTKSARVLAVVAVVVGFASLLHGVGLVTGFLIADPQVLSGVRSPGRAIDFGFYIIFAAVALGTLAEISFSIRKWSA